MVRLPRSPRALLETPAGADGVMLSPRFLGDSTVRCHQGHPNCTGGASELPLQAAGAQPRLSVAGRG